MEVSHEKVRIESFDHVAFILFSERRLPSVAILAPPLPVRLPNFPVGANHRVPLTCRILTIELVAEIVRDFLELRCGRRVKQR